MLRIEFDKTFLTGPNEGITIRVGYNVPNTDLATQDAKRLKTRNLDEPGTDAITGHRWTADDITIVIVGPQLNLKAAAELAIEAGCTVETDSCWIGYSKALAGNTIIPKN